MEYAGGARTKGNMSWTSRHALEAHYEMTGAINYQVIKKPKTAAQLEKERLRPKKEKADFDSPHKMPKLLKVDNI